MNKRESPNFNHQLRSKLMNLPSKVTRAMSHTGPMRSSRSITHSMPISERNIIPAKRRQRYESLPRTWIVVWYTGNESSKCWWISLHYAAISEQEGFFKLYHFEFWDKWEYRVARDKFIFWPRESDSSLSRMNGWISQYRAIHEFTHKKWEPFAIAGFLSSVSLSPRVWWNFGLLRVCNERGGTPDKAPDTFVTFVSNKFSGVNVSLSPVVLDLQPTNFICIDVAPHKAFLENELKTFLKDEGLWKCMLWQDAPIKLYQRSPESRFWIREVVETSFRKRTA